MKTTLPTLSEVVDITANMAYDGNFITNHIWDYNDFLKQPLKLEMFIPCKDGVPLEEPSRYDDWINGTFYNIELEGKMKQYQQSLDRVIFKGFEIIDYNGRSTVVVNLGMLDFDKKPVYYHVFWFIKTDKIWVLSKGLKSISDLTQKVDLVDKEYERLGL